MVDDFYWSFVYLFISDLMAQFLPTVKKRYFIFCFLCVLLEIYRIFAVIALLSDLGLRLFTYVEMGTGFFLVSCGIFEVGLSISSFFLLDILEMGVCVFHSLCGPVYLYVSRFLSSRIDHGVKFGKFGRYPSDELFKFCVQVIIKKRKVQMDVILKFSIVLILFLFSIWYCTFPFPRYTPFGLLKVIFRG